MSSSVLSNKAVNPYEVVYYVRRLDRLRSTVFDLDNSSR